MLFKPWEYDNGSTILLSIGHMRAKLFDSIEFHILDIQIGFPFKMITLNYTINFALLKQ